jgi:H+-translocating NAD(P) transhydrogenase subunit alpha
LPFLASSAELGVRAALTLVQVARAPGHNVRRMRIVAPRETAHGEQRVALVPESCKKLIQAGYEIAIESGAGDAAGYPDASYRELGVDVQSDPASLLESADLLLKITAPAVGEPGREEVRWLRPGTIYLGSLMPLRNLAAVRALAERKITAFSTDAIPRTTRAQSMDTLSSMANISGYKGVLLAAVALNRYFPMLMTAAGMVRPAKVFVIGAGVAGLQAIATAKRLGANVVATDVRPEVKEQIESVGAKYVGIELQQSAAAGGGYAKELSQEDQERQRQLLIEECAQSDVIITTALIGGVFAPLLLTAATVERMKPGSMIIDLAADGGGNCELSKPGQTVSVGGVTILAPLNVPATMPFHASLLFSRNLTAFIQAFTKETAFHLDFTDDIQQGALITHDGEVRHARTRDALQKTSA